MLRTTITRHVGLNARLFATSARHQKSATDSVKDGVKAVHDSASKAALKGVEATGMSSTVLFFSVSVSVQLALYNL